MAIFYVDQLHESEKCPAAQGYTSDLWNDTLGAIMAQASSNPWGVVTRSLLVNGPEHRLALVLEARTMQDLVAFLEPIQGLGEATVRVMDDLVALSAT